MKKLLTIGLIAASTSLCIAQTNDIKSNVITFAQNVESNRNIAVTLYPIYAPKIVVNGKPDTFGAGLAVLTPVSIVNALADNKLAQHSFIGLRFDYLAHEAFASTVGVGLRGDMQVFGHNFEGFVHSGVNVPFSGFGLHNGDLGAMAGGGVYTPIVSFGKTLSDGTKAGVFGIQGAAEKWTQFSGYQLLGGPVLNYRW